MDNFAKYSEVIKLLQECGDIDLSEKLTKLQTKRNTPFMVCAVGGFSHGKTHLLNQIVGTDSLPESSLPTTTLVTEIRTGAEEGFQYVSDDGQTSFCGRLTKHELSRFSAKGDMADARGRLVVTVKGDFPRGNAFLCDTPGTDDLVDTRAKETFQALERSDAVMVAITALSPMSLIEKAFLEIYLNQKAIPHAAIVVTFLDKVEEEDRAETLRYIVKKAREWNSELEVWCLLDSPGLFSVGCSAMGVDAIRQKLSDWQDDPRLIELRSKRDARIVLDVLTAARERQEILKTDLISDLESRKTAIREAKKRLDVDSDNWNIILSEFRAHGDETADFVFQLCQEAQFDLLDKVSQQKILDKKNYILVTEGVRIQKNIQDKLWERIENDRISLVKHIKEAFPGDEVGNVDITNGSVIFDADYSFTKIEDQHSIVKDMVDFYNKYAQLLDPIIPKKFLFIKNAIDGFVESIPRIFGISADQVFTDSVNNDFIRLSTEIHANIRTIYDNIAIIIRQLRIHWLDRRLAELEGIHGINDIKAKIDLIDKHITEISALSKYFNAHAI